MKGNVIESRNKISEIESYGYTKWKAYVNKKGRKMGKKTNETLKLFFAKEDFEPLYDPVLVSLNLILKAELHPNALKLLKYMAEKASSYNPEIHITAEEIQEELGFSQKTFYRWLKQLIELGLVKRIAKNIYKVNFQSVFCEVKVPDSE